jgi:hypothetical protein
MYVKSNDKKFQVIGRTFKTEILSEEFDCFLQIVKILNYFKVNLM